ILKGNILFYKERPSDRDVLGVIVLEGCTVQLCESDEQFAFSLVWSEAGLRTYKFSAEDQSSQESWIKALVSAKHSYVALLLSDMERMYTDALDSQPAKTSTLPNHSRTEVESPGASMRTSHTSTLPSFHTPPLGAGLGISSNQMLQLPIVPVKAAGKKSPKLWPTRSGNVLPGNASALALGELGLCSDNEDFSKMHDDYGKDIRELIADWSKRGSDGNVVQEENLIDFG
uniref:Sesquipedalian n=2 Tax=Gouania willdenowi TaxID=441366 RepID=A0A8C5HR49_GOUWI